MIYDVVAIIVAYRTKDKVAETLSSLFLDIADSGLNVKAVVVDNASGANFGGMIREKFPQVDSILNQTNVGYGAANNIAFKRYEAKYYFIINPDITFPPGQNIVKRFYDFMEANQKIGLAGPKLILSDGDIQPSCQRFPKFWDQPIFRLELHKRYNWARKRVEKFQMADFSHNKPVPVDWVVGAAFFIRSAALAKVGGFDERYFAYFEDCDLCREFWEAGWPVFYKADISLLHGHERSSAKIPGLRSIFQNKLTRIHLKSWLQYWLKWQKTE